MTNEPATHMTPELFRDVGIRMLDEINAYFAGIEQRPVQPATKPGDVAAQIGRLLTEEPGTPDTWNELLQQVRDVVIPNTMHWQSPAFFGYFPCNTSAPAILGELLCAGLGGQGMLWQTAPAANEIERELLDQMAEAMQLPERFLSSSDNGGGCIQPTASDSTL
ncbi:MAG: pyridoxal-dependent decarboxylase, partial [Planctomycetota bacterium]